MSIALAAALVIGGAGAAPAAAVAHLQARADQPPFPYADCINAAKQNKESAAHAKWHCDELVKKGWIKKPLGNEGQVQKAQPKKPEGKKAEAGKPEVKTPHTKTPHAKSPHAKRDHATRWHSKKAHTKRLRAKKSHAGHPHS
ncbi:hypothetical protein [Streptomyces sp. NPDC020667]|uniref:hypothetical protein n=1 Tax=Streptomyces sp. NPDC020667 TaxID=3154895 RepID=UPI00340743E8